MLSGQCDSIDCLKGSVADYIKVYMVWPLQDK